MVLGGVIGVEAFATVLTFDLCSFDSNIREDIDLLGDGKGIIQVPDVTACWQKIEHLLANPDQAKELGIQAQQSVRQRTHILNDYLTTIKPYL